MTLHIQYAFLLCTALFHLSQARWGNDAMDCCLEVSHKVIPRKIVAAYKVQGSNSGCRIQAVVFVTVKNRKLCAPHDARWVKNLMRWSDKTNGSSG
ncbi:C-C motif chemokine 19-like [Amblyraja radiata]|uniref:C-C motif chemokine 19-like n=1 Tax=Amblyraja radiata TaxID=386614 RepID=UPI001403618C|nr:C-C motif chemokine 19-like [Amblyraja radiata]